MSDIQGHPEMVHTPKWSSAWELDHLNDIVIYLFLRETCTSQQKLWPDSETRSFFSFSCLAFAAVESTSEMIYRLQNGMKQLIYKLMGFYADYLDDIHI